MKPVKKHCKAATYFTDNIVCRLFDFILSTSFLIIQLLSKFGVGTLLIEMTEIIKFVLKFDIWNVNENW